MSEEPGTLNNGEPHPAAHDAMKWIKENISTKELLTTREAMASCAIGGSRLGEVCVGTIDRLINGEPVSDRYLLGLAWYLIRARVQSPTRNYNAMWSYMVGIRTDFGDKMSENQKTSLDQVIYMLDGVRS